MRDLIGGNILVHQRNVMLVGGTGTGTSHLGNREFAGLHP